MRGAHRFMEEFVWRQNIASIVIKILLLNYLCWFLNIDDIYINLFLRVPFRVLCCVNFTLQY